MSENNIEDANRLKHIEASLRNKYKHKIMNKFVRAICDYDLVRPDDKIAVCISGGKDSMLMAKLFQELKRRNKIPFEIKFLCMDPGYAEKNRRQIEYNAALLNIPITIFKTKVFDAVYHVEQNPCYLCAKMRRGFLYRYAQEAGCNKIALGHHFNDIIETNLMSMIYGGEIRTMMPKVKSANWEGMELIRPMYYVREVDIKSWRDENHLQFLQCACRFTEQIAAASPDEPAPSKRQEIKQLIAALAQENPQVPNNIFHAMENVNLSVVLNYKRKGVLHNVLDEYDDADSDEDTCEFL
jgi:tRNA(Ile)-lysidine synthase TilS/MesJ